MSITREHISRIENGNHIPSAEFIKTVSIAFNVLSDWILANRKYNNADKLLSDNELNLIEHYRRLPPALREKIFELINSILDS